MISFRCSSLVLTCLLLAAPSLVRAQGFQIEKVFAGDGKVLPLVTDSNALGESLLIHYNNNRGRMQDAIRGQLGAGNLIAGGVTLYNVNVQLGNASTRFINNNQMEVTINGNHLYAKSTTPTALGSWADPAFEVNFNLRCVVSFTLPTLSRPRIDVTSAVVQIPWIQIKPRNVVGGVLTTVGAITNFFVKVATGRDLIRSKLSPYLTRDVTDILNRRLVRVNQFLAEAAKEGYKNPKVTQFGERLIKLLMTKEKVIKAVGRIKFPATTAADAAKLKVVDTSRVSDAIKQQQPSTADLIKKMKLIQVQPKLPSPVGPIVK